YVQKVRKAKDELEEFWRCPIEPWAADPIKWWAARRATFPRLSRMALDILSIPGKHVVAVERVFSGGRDTISLRHTRLAANTIQALMITKQWI
ncbi:HAT dimerization, partial [Exidia glandulosa HHB12029]